MPDTVQVTLQRAWTSSREDWPTCGDRRESAAGASVWQARQARVAQDLLVETTLGKLLAC